MAYKILVTRTIPEVGLHLLSKKKNYELDIWDEKEPIPRSVLLKRVRGCHAILTLLSDKIDEELLYAAGPQLKIVANYAVGYDNIDLQAARAHNVIITNTPEVLNQAVAEQTIALMFAVSKRIVEADAFTRAQQYKSWQPDLMLGIELGGKTLGIIGAGRIGSMVAHIAHQGLGMHILYSGHAKNEALENELNAKRVTQTQLLKKSDVVSLHVPLLPETRHLISTKELAIMKPTAILINTARGPVVDEKALLKALDKKQLFGAGLDVYECEPAIDCDTTDHLELRALKNVVLTPHSASATHEARTEMARIAASNIIAVLSNKKPLTPVV